MSKSYIVDIETDGLNPSVIYMIGILNLYTDEWIYFSEENVAEGILFIADADMIIGHNLLGYDIVVIEKLIDKLVTFDRNKIVDTYKLSKSMFPDLKSQKLEVWGDILGLPKLDQPDFNDFTPEMVEYCKRDCEVTKRLFLFLLAMIEDNSNGPSIT